MKIPTLRRQPVILKRMAGFLLGYNRNKTLYILICCISLAFFSLASSVYAIDAKSNIFQMELITLMNGGGPASSANFGMKFSSVGDPVITVEQLESLNFKSVTSQAKILFYPFLPPEVIKVISNLRALTEVLGSPISEGIWQKDNDPYFYWNIAIEPQSAVSGFSVSLDTLPEQTVNTTSTYYQFAEDSIASGRHTFYVLPFLSSNNWEQDSLLKFDLLVDIEPPLIYNTMPASGELVSDNYADISANIYDAGSGLDLGLTKITLNNNNMYYAYDPVQSLLEVNLASPAPEGKNTVFLKAYDLLGNNVVKGWDFIVDTLGPQGTMRINNGAEITHSAFVFLNLDAQDTTAGIKNVYISNDGVFDAELSHPYAYHPVIYNWMVTEPDTDGIKTVYARFEDSVGNLSEVQTDQIYLKLMSPDTRIISGPQSATELTDAAFKFEASKPDCLFSYKIDEQDWSGWVSVKEVTFSGLSEANHYFYVKSAFDLNGDEGITIDEEDPTPAQWVWTVHPSGYMEKLKEKILFWRR